MEALDISYYPQLKELWLNRCRSLTRLTCIEPSEALTELQVIGCESLVELPDLSIFPRLETLRLKECRAVRRLTCSSPLTALRKVELVGCDRRLEILRFRTCKNFVVDIFPPQAMVKATTARMIFSWLKTMQLISRRSSMSSGVRGGYLQCFKQFLTSVIVHYRCKL